MTTKLRRFFLARSDFDDVNKVKVELCAKTTVHACAFGVMCGKPQCWESPDVY